MSSLSRCGFCFLRWLARGGICMSTTGLQRSTWPTSRYIHNLLSMHPCMRALDGTPFSALHHFSTSVNNEDGNKETEETKSLICPSDTKPKKMWCGLRVLLYRTCCPHELVRISVTFVDRDGEEKTIKVPIGWSILEAAHANDIDLEGACEASLACSTCHVIVMDVDYYNKLEEPTDEENDMLDLAFGLTETSRLGCQIIARRELDGIHLAIPSATRNFAVDGFIPKPH